MECHRQQAEVDPEIVSTSPTTPSREPDRPKYQVRQSSSQIMVDPFTIGAAVYGVISATPGLMDVVKKYAGAPKALKDEVAAVDAVCNLVQNLALENKDIPLPEPLCEQLKRSVKLCGDVMEKYQDANFVQRMLNARKAADRLENVRRAKDSMMNVHDIIGLELQQRQGAEVTAALKEQVEHLKYLETGLKAVVGTETAPASASNAMNLAGLFYNGTINQGSNTTNNYH
jgi:hypothetical protein